MPAARPAWIGELSSSFRRHRKGRTGWFIEIHRDRLRLSSSEFPPRPGEAMDEQPTKRSLTLQTEPGPATAARALAEACAVFDGVMEGAWRWPDPDGIPRVDDALRLQPECLKRLSERLEARMIGESMVQRTWDRTWAPYLQRLVSVAGERRWPADQPLLEATLRKWESNSRSRQMAYDRARRLWKEAGWPWPEELAPLRGNGKAAADPAGVRAFSDQEIEQLRERIQASTKLLPADLVAWDCLVVFGLRPQELVGLELIAGPGAVAVAVVSRSKVSSKGKTKPRQVPAVPPAGWPRDCHGLLTRWRDHGLPGWSQTAASPGERMTKQLRRLRMPEELKSYGLRHAFALRLGLDLGLHVREASELCGHSPAVHLSAYGRRLDGPGLLAKVAALSAERAG